MRLKRKRSALELPVKFVLKRVVPLERKVCARFERPARVASEKVVSIPVRVVDEYVSDRPKLKASLSMPSKALFFGKRVAIKV